jgi:hypothetical protein
MAMMRLYRLGLAARIVLAASLIAMPGTAAGSGADVASDVALKAAFIYNFVKFAEWPALPPGSTILVCITGDDAVAAALLETVRGKNISGHPLEVWRPPDSTAWRACHLLFIADAETRRSADALSVLRKLPVLTVSDGKGFAQTSGIVELYADAGRMRFAINVDAVERSGLRLSSRLLGLASVVRNGHVQ